jgi:hypothetical protein
MPENLWPDFDIGQAPRSPKAVIQQAGGGLREKTDGLVQFWMGPASIRDNKVELSCSLYTPALGYHYPFLRAQFAVEPVYPVTLVADKMPDIVANDEKELIEALAKIFNAPSTIATIQRLMSLSQG